MSSVADALLGKGPLASALGQAVETISDDETLTFTLYNRAVLPLDGLVFWIASTTTQTVEGSFHYAINTEQDEASSQAITEVLFATETQLDNLLTASPMTKWIAIVDGLHVAFTRAKNFYDEAGLYHYVARALLPTEASQVIDSPTSLNPSLLIASNSLPAFLLLNTYTPPYYCPYIPANLPTLYPSFLVPANLQPPYAVVHVERSEAQAPVPWQDANSNPYQLATDDVRITMYGLSNNQAALLRDAIVAFSRDQQVIGIQGDIGAIRDERQPQSDFLIVAQKKTMMLRVSYLQTAVVNFARQVFKQIQTTYTPEPV